MFSSLFPISERNLYADNVLSIKRFGASTYRVSHCRKLRRSGYEKLETSGDKQKKPDFSFDGKRDNNISRARTAVWSIALSNPFTHYVTLTFDKQKVPDRYCRHDLMKAVCRFFNDYSKNRNIPPLKYLLIPELHKDGAFHLHGLISGIRDKDLFINENRYLDWRQWRDKFGFINISEIEDVNRISAYITKYITKDLAKETVKGERLYYCSKGLSRGEKILQIENTNCSMCDFQFISNDGFFRVSTLHSLEEVNSLLQNMTLYDDGCVYDEELDDFIPLNEGFAPLPEDFKNDSTGSV